MTWRSSWLVGRWSTDDGRRTGLCQLSGSGNICERAILVSGNMRILTVLVEELQWLMRRVGWREAATDYW